MWRRNKGLLSLFRSKYMYTIVTERQYVDCGHPSEHYILAPEFIDVFLAANEPSHLPNIDCPKCMVNLRLPACFFQRVKLE